ncbi:mitochondrial carrier domain-containing protein [Jimgerdemannia flammicorona]|uniref:Mitochondrial carrier domain-containing protein n=1 Tax=Jimgerdemannia flammicorona TaxID=994334 RepID=A0A433CYM8_9FUNG|nr:mitochondrial carrier domain-containing protein [Jimgerdemannia flammicorona]
MAAQEFPPTDFPVTDSGFIRAVKDCVSGTVGGIVQVLTGQPFDTVKVRLQTQPLPAPGQPPLYTGMADCVKKTLQKEGWTGFYKGTVTPLVGIGACVSIQFVVLEHMKRRFRAQNHGLPFTNTQLYIAGAASGLANSVVSGPVEHIRTRLQVQTGSGTSAQYSGPVDAIRKIYREHGLFRGIYKGQAVTMVREFQGYGAYFLSYEYLVRETMASSRLKHRNEIPTWKVCAFGAVAGYAMWLTVYPVDVIKSKIQTNGFTAATRAYNSAWDCVVKTWRKEGMKGFFRGFGPCILRAAPVNAATFVGFEAAMRVLN